MEYKVAPSYQNWQIEKIDEDAHKAYVSTQCPKCGGSGQFAWFGMCFTCEGHGYIGKWVKIYSVPEYEKYIAAQERAKEKRAEKERARIEDLDNNSEKNKRALLEKFGFDPENPMVYLIAGGNTFEIKDELKARGGRYNAAFNWHFTKETEVPEGYQLVAVPFDSVYDWFPRTKRIELKDNAKEIAEAAKNTITTDSTSEFIGDIKQRLRDMKVTLTAAREIDSMYGLSTMFTFDYNGNTLIWFTSSPPKEEDAIVGNEYLLTGTVKNHKIYDGVKQTYLNRCILKKFAI